MKDTEKTSFQDFETLINAGAMYMIMNIEHGNSRKPGVMQHLKETNAELCQSTQDIKKAFDTCLLIHDRNGVQGLYDVVTKATNLNEFYTMAR